MRRRNIHDRGNSLFNLRSKFIIVQNAPLLVRISFTSRDEPTLERANLLLTIRLIHHILHHLIHFLTRQ